MGSKQRQPKKPAQTPQPAPTPLPDGKKGGDPRSPRGSELPPAWQMQRTNERGT